MGRGRRAPLAIPAKPCWAEPLAGFARSGKEVGKESGTERSAFRLVLGEEGRVRLGVSSSVRNAFA